MYSLCYMIWLSMFLICACAHAGVDGLPLIVDQFHQQGYCQLGMSAVLTSVSVYSTQNVNIMSLQCWIMLSPQFSFNQCFESVLSVSIHGLFYFLVTCTFHTCTPKVSVMKSPYICTHLCLYSCAILVVRDVTIHCLNDLYIVHIHTASGYSNQRLLHCNRNQMQLFVKKSYRALVRFNHVLQIFTIVYNPNCEVIHLSIHP